MRRFALALCFCLAAPFAGASPQVDRLVDAIGLPALIDAFATEGIEGGARLDADILNGQGGDVWAETVREIYNPQRLQAELRMSMAEGLDEDVVAQALLFFESDLGARIVELEVEARRAMLNPELEAAARAAGAEAGTDLRDFLDTRDLVERNTEAAMNAQAAFFTGMRDAATKAVPVPDLEAQRPAIAEETESWLLGYYALAQSPLSADDVAIYRAFWETDVGGALDDALFEAFGDSYATLSYALGQAAGRLLPASEL